MDPGRIFQIITNSTLLATRLVSGPGASSLEFSEPRYCAVLPEDTPQAATVLTVAATHAKGAEVRYSITGGNKDGLFTIDQRTGTVTLAAALDFEINNKHDLVVAAEGGGETTYAKVRVRVNDVNDNAPYFIDPQPEVVVVEEDDRHLPATIATVSAQDSDWLDHHGLLYTVRGDGVDGLDPADAFFTINSLTGDLIQLRPLDRDPPRGKPVWRVRVQVRDGQALWSRQAMHRHLASLPKRGNVSTLKKTRLRGKRGTRSDSRAAFSPSSVAGKAHSGRTTCGGNAARMRVTNGNSMKKAATPERGAEDSMPMKEKKPKREERRGSQNEAALSLGSDDISGSGTNTWTKKSQIAHAAISGERCQHAHHTETFKLRGIVDSKGETSLVILTRRKTQNGGPHRHTPAIPGSILTIWTVMFPCSA
ncbi:putative neural-cadherin 2 [Scylla paramamosain]|uniref:putative neural-cadherin 2 n=1 Tax=Scylla paramamosain TaxID=85552 RepID=UPI00308386A2